MFAQIDSLASSLGISRGELLLIAREIAGDARLRAVEEMYAEHALALFRRLVEVQASVRFILDGIEPAETRARYPQAA